MKEENNSSNNIVLPVSITLYNLVTSQIINSKDMNNHRFADASVLQPVTLQIIRKQKKRNSNKAKAGYNNETVLGNKEELLDVEVLKVFPHMPAFRPKWEDINDSISSIGSSSEEEIDYQSLYARIVLYNNNNTDNEILIGDVSLYPPLLRIIPRDTPLPEQLPPNTLLIQCSDSCLRMNPSTHDILVSKNMLPLLPSPGNPLFSDHAFDILPGNKHQNADDENATPLGRQHASNNKASSSKDDLFADDLFSLLGTSPPTPELEVLQNSSSKTQVSPVLPQPSTPPPPPPEQQSLEAQQHHLLQLQQHLSTLEDIYKFEKQQYLYDKKDLRLEMDRLQELLNSFNDVHHQSELLESQTQNELAFIQNSKEMLFSRQRVLLKQLLQIYPIQKIPETSNNNAGQSTRYTIRSIELPLEVTYSTSYYSSYYYYSTSSAIYDDQISTALGYTSHLLLMVCDYFNISLRYPIVHNASRSMIQNYHFRDINGNSTVYPLFKMSLVEKEMLETGLDLLRKNIDGVCSMLSDKNAVMGNNSNVSGKGEQVNILGKLKNLFQYLLRVDDSETGVN